MSSKNTNNWEEMQVAESQLQNFLMQEQTVQMEINEITNALGELKQSGDEVYRVLSGVMMKMTKEKIESELNEKKKFLNVRLEAIDKQEKLLKKRIAELRGKINKNVEKKDR